jgi:hypothetical protein
MITAEVERLGRIQAHWHLITPPAYPPRILPRALTVIKALKSF